MATAKKTPQKWAELGGKGKAKRVAGVTAYAALQTSYGSKYRSKFYSQGRRATQDIRRGKSQVYTPSGHPKTVNREPVYKPITKKTVALAAAYTIVSSPWAAKAKNRYYTRSNRQKNAAIDYAGTTAYRRASSTKMGSGVIRAAKGGL